MEKRGARSVGRREWDTWPTYDAAILGLRNYWYPVLWSRQLGRKPRAVTLLGEQIMLVRDRDGKAYALNNRCPHRGVPLSLGKQEFPRTWSCWYHGWTYRWDTGDLVGILTNPESSQIGKHRIRTFPVEEAKGITLRLRIGRLAPVIQRRSGFRISR